MSSMDELKVRYVVRAKLLGQDKGAQKKSREKEYAIQVTLSDESQYTMFRTLKDIAVLQSRLISRFPVEAGYFKKSERVIPDCPVKQTIFGVQRAISDDRSFEKLLNSYIKELPGLPASIVKCDLVSEFFSLKASDIQVPGENKSKDKSSSKGRKKHQVVANEDSTISGPMSLRSYYAVSSYSDKKSKFSIDEGAVVQVMKKDPGGWWMVDNRGQIGWAPASFLVPVDPEDLQNEAQENEQLIEPEKVGARYISISSYQASREDELSFVRGAVVKVIKKYVDGWWLVRYNGGEGYVPGAMFKRFDKRQATVYVKRIRRNFISRKSTKIVPTIKPKWMHHNERATQRNGQAKTEAKPTLVLYQCKAIYEGVAERFELTMNKNDTVKVLDKKDHGWWYAEDMHGRSGWVPATYLRPILDAGTNRLAGGEKIVGSVQKILQPHKAQQEDELSVRRGESVEVLSVSVDGWWTVRNSATGKQGLIPSLCITHEGQEEELAEITEEEEALESRSEPLLGSPDDQSMVSDLSSQSTSALSKWTETGSLEDLDEAGDEMVLDGCYIATEDYIKQAMDEIDLFEGQIVCVIDDTDDDVWYVNCDGKEGWVPADILKEYVDEEGFVSGESTPDTSRLSSNPVSSDECEDVDDSRKRNGRAISPGFSRHSNRAIKRSIPTHEHESSKTQLKPIPPTRKISTESNHSTTSTSPPVTIMVDDKSLDQLEREIREAERRAAEAQQLAQRLKQRVEYARTHSNETHSTTSH